MHHAMRKPINKYRSTGRVKEIEQYNEVIGKMKINKALFTDRISYAHVRVAQRKIWYSIPFGETRDDCAIFLIKEAKIGKAFVRRSVCLYTILKH